MDEWSRATSEERRSLTDAWTERDPELAAAVLRILAESIPEAADEDRGDFSHLGQKLFWKTRGETRGHVLESLAIGARDEPPVLYRSGWKRSSWRHIIGQTLRACFREWIQENPETLERWFSTPSGQGVGRPILLSFYRAKDHAEIRDRTAELLWSQIREHPQPEARAWALGAWVVANRSIPQRKWLREVYERESNPDVRRFMIRLSAFPLSSETTDSGLPLDRIILETEEPRIPKGISEGILEDAIRAWVLSGRRFQPSPRVEYFPDRWIELSRLKCDRRVPVKKYPAAIEARLRSILASRSEPSLRDACSMALSETAHGRVEGFRFAEWGVWSEGKNSLTSPEQVIADLPPFVHRSEVLVQTLRERHKPRGGVINKPVIFMRSPTPLAVDLRILFAKGRPWTFYPEITQYLIGISSETALADDSEITPPWITVPNSSDLGSPTRLNADSELERRYDYDIAPWLKPQTDRRGLGRHPFSIASVGVRWNGLRVGDGIEHEPRLEPVEPDHWWRHLRAVPSQSVSIRGEREKFLFYDGSTSADGPLLTAWTDDQRNTIALRPRSLSDYDALRSVRGFHDTLRHHDRADHAMPGAFVIHVMPSGRCRGQIIGPIEFSNPGIQLQLPALPLNRELLRAQMSAKLQDLGLTEPESESLLLTWQREFLDAPGTRVLTILPEWLYDRLLPAQIKPRPTEIVRVGIVWKESESFDVGPSWIPSSKPKLCSIERDRIELKRDTITPETSRAALLLEHLGQSGYSQFEFGDHEELTLRHRGSRDAHSVFSLSLKSGVAKHWATTSGAPVIAAQSRTRLAYGEDGSLTVLDIHNGERWRFETNEKIEALCLSGDGKRIGWVSMGADSQTTAHVAELETGKRWNPPSPFSRGFRWSQQPSVILLSSDGNEVLIRNSQRDDGLLYFDLEASTVSDVTANRDPELPIRFAPDGKIALHRRTQSLRRPVFLDPSQVPPKITDIVDYEPGHSFVQASHDFRYVQLADARRLEGHLIDRRTGRRWKSSQMTTIQILAFDPQGDRFLIRDRLAPTRLEILTLEEFIPRFARPGPGRH